MRSVTTAKRCSRWFRASPTSPPVTPVIATAAVMITSASSASRSSRLRETPLREFRAVHPDERLRRLSGLLGHLEQAYLDRYVPVAGVQVPDLIPHSSRQLRVSEIRAARRHGISMKVITVILQGWRREQADKE